MPNKKAKGKRAKTRRKLKRKGTRLTIAQLLKKPDVGARIQVNIDSSVHAGLPPKKYQGMIGKVLEHRRLCVEVEMENGKSMSLHPVHLKVLGK